MNDFPCHNCDLHARCPYQKLSECELINLRAALDKAKAENAALIKRLYEVNPNYDGEVDALRQDNARLRAELTEVKAERDAAVVIVETVDKDGWAYQFEHYLCPGCKNIIAQRPMGAKTPLYRPKYCQDCGQKLEWRGTTGTEERG